MFGPSFADCWYSIPGVPVLELSGDLRFRSPNVVRKQQYDVKGRPFAWPAGRPGDYRMRLSSERRVMLHRAVMSVVLGRELAAGEFVCHRDDVAAQLAGQPVARRSQEQRGGQPPQMDARRRGIVIRPSSCRKNRCIKVRIALARGEREETSHGSSEFTRV